MPPIDSTADDDASGGFLSRWSRRKVLGRQGVPLADREPAPPPPVPVPEPSSLAGLAAPTVVPAAPRQAATPAAAEPIAAQAETQPEAPPTPTLADVAALTQDSDFTRFVAPGVDTGVKNAALKKLFTAPHFNVMDGLDTYIDDYGKADPLPAGMLRQMAQSHALGLFSDDPPEPMPALPQPAQVAIVADATEDAVAEPASLVAPDPDQLQDPTPDENPDLRLQPHHAAGSPSPGPGLGQAAGGEHGRD